MITLKHEDCQVFNEETAVQAVLFHMWPRIINIINMFRCEGRIDHLRIGKPGEEFPGAYSSPQHSADGECGCRYDEDQPPENMWDAFGLCPTGFKELVIDINVQQCPITDIIGDEETVESIHVLIQNFIESFSEVIWYHFISEESRIYSFFRGELEALTINQAKEFLREKNASIGFLHMDTDYCL